MLTILHSMQIVIQEQVLYAHCETQSGIGSISMTMMWP